MLGLFHSASSPGTAAAWIWIAAVTSAGQRFAACFMNVRRVQSWGRAVSSALCLQQNRKVYWPPSCCLCALWTILRQQTLQKWQCEHPPASHVLVTHVHTIQELFCNFGPGWLCTTRTQTELTPCCRVYKEIFAMTFTGDSALGEKAQFSNEMVKSK